MPPFLVLVLCTAFTLFLLRLERKQAPGVSRALWIPTIWMFFSVSKPLGVWFHAGGTMESGSPLDRALLIIFLLISLPVLSKRNFNWYAAIRENAWLMVLVGYMLVSVLWSPIPNISFKRSVKELVAVAMAFFVLSELNPRQAIQSIFRRTIYVLIPFSVVLIKYYPEYGVDYHVWTGRRMWIGVTQQKNSLGLLCIISAFFLIWVLRRRWQGRDLPVTKYQIYVELFLLFVSLWLLGGPQSSLKYSSTSLIAFTIALFTFLGLLWAKKRGLILGASTLKVMAVLIIIYGTVTPFLGRLSIMDVSSVVGRDESLTGRSEIWSTLVPFAMRRPLVGYGFGGFWTTSMRELTSANAHNGYLDVLLNLGFVGLVLVSSFVLSCCNKVKLAMAYDNDWGILFVCYILMALVHNIAESSIATLTSSLTIIILFFSVSSTKGSLLSPSP